jgi:hypothetical protein
MNAENRTTRCQATACLFNVTGDCRHALRPQPGDCPHRRAVATHGTAGVVSFLGRGRHFAQPVQATSVAA